ncbi:hypothetical protein [Belliella pelovolcani]|uniref:hypothetical protein n=1 Tax=Belliella pelovolcani TaxID=529505 RepID=UPI0039197F58
MSNSQSHIAIFKEVTKHFSLVKSKMLSQAINQGKGRAIYQDAFTGKLLWADDSFEFGYIYSPKMICETYQAVLSEEEIAQVINCPSNVIVTHTEVLASLRDQDPDTWIKNQALENTLNIDLALAARQINKAKMAIANAANQYLKDKP